MVQRCQVFPLVPVEHWTGLQQKFHSYLAQELLATRRLDLCLAAANVFEFVSDARSWPTFRFHGIRQMQEASQNHFKFQSACGGGSVVMEVKKQEMQLDYSIFVEHEDLYKVAIQILTKTNDACDLVISIVKPRRMPISYFESKLSLMDGALENLKRILEGRQHR